MKLEPLVITISSQLRVRLVYAYDGPVFAGALQMRQEHPSLTAWFVREGRVTVRTPPSHPAATARPGQWLLLPARPREHEMAPGTRLLSVRFELEQPSGAPWLVPGPALRVAGKANPDLEATATRLVAATLRLWRPSPVHDQFVTMRPEASAVRNLHALLGWSEALQSWTVTLLETVLKRRWKLAQTEGVSGHVQEARDYLLQRGFTVPLRLAEVAEAVGLSVTHLKRLFREELGTTPLRWWNQLRLEEARRRLRETGEPVKTIAYELGFNSPAHFSAWFRQHMTISPARYRQRGGGFNV